jgi:Fe-S oxidoreductase
MPGAFRKYQRLPFDAERCTRCGLCLSECPVMQLPEDEAKTEIECLIDYFRGAAPSSVSTQKVLRACTSCFACNLVCPAACRPANLFLDIWHDEYKRDGLPATARYFLPHSRPNFRTYVVERLSRELRDIVESWQTLEPAEEIFYPGCNLITTPYLTRSRLFDGLPIRGSLDYCCGEMYFRMGLYEQLEQVARKCTGYFQKLRAKRVYLQCTAGLNMFTNVLPQFGADFAGIEFIPFLKRLHDKLVSGALPVVKRFDGKTVAIQDSCHAKIFEPDFDEWPRKILRFLGFTIAEAPLHSTRGLCCGIGSGFSHGAGYGKASMIAGQRDCVHNLKRAHADYVAVYCSGCLEMLSVSRYVARLDAPAYHVLELVQEAIGETPARQHRKVAFDFLAGTLRNQHGGKRFFPPPIE